ncbi:MAG: DUF2094 domain-containing protein [Gammaproteobacteria bacterium]|nr:DUF2094 domain-containing protein [Gammaproteobacteria bacterium]
MSWTGLFGSKGPRFKPDPRVRWFGKLPTYADYYTSRNDEEWSVEFNKWVLEGFETYLTLARREASTAQPRHTHAVARLPLAAGAIRLPNSNMTVLASFHDYGGDMVGRPFPLCFYVGVPTAQWPGPTSGSVGASVRVLSELIALREQVTRHFNAPGGFETRFSSLEIDLAGLNGTQDATWAAAAATIPMAEWFAAAQAGDDEAGLEAWLAAVRRGGDQSARLESPDFKPTFVLPLAAGIALPAQLAGWLQWLGCRMDLERRALTLLVVADADGGFRRLAVIARELSVDDFLLLTPMAGHLRYVDDLSRVKPVSDGDANTASLVDVPANWAAFVQEILGGGRNGGEHANV